ncbi:MULTISPECIES: RNA-binding cell elongation regulator Jag/EloR [unclassified Butyrivibrio]|uniref:RNA-binding cell elongation regulator Jag/EloR n=1 Tax=unclassified Butyrivibrio TaxID=2639466 RepID=UPI0008E5A054|nr:MULTISPECIES: RNA-binding cell elongation regulator Jag/EloR [unclassified Butyrivibrio]RKM61606.1 protein jag [Butyrivibrio sp. XB500-5]SFU63397.1 spoIIIJ-associated protein [Butyrivibrio sp. INlla21]
MEYREFTAKNVDDAITEACEALLVTSDRLDYEVVTSGSSGFLGINAKPAVIKARIKEDKPEEKVEVKTSEPKKEVKSEPKKETKKVSEEPKVSKVSDIDAGKLTSKADAFLKEVFDAMKMEVAIESKFNAEDNILDIELSGAEMGVLIGKRGQTLDSLQYLVSLVVNKESADYIHVKVDTENYRERRKATLENLAKNISYKVRKSRQSVALEPMNPYERRIIHSALQGDRYVTTHSEGEEPFRRVVVTLKK